MDSKLVPVNGALYRNKLTGKDLTLLGLRRKVVVLRGVDGMVEEPTYEEFSKNYVDLNQHDHETYCCDVHKTHAPGMHQGCVLR